MKTSSSSSVPSSTYALSLPRCALYSAALSSDSWVIWEVDFLAAYLEGGFSCGLSGRWIFLLLIWEVDFLALYLEGGFSCCLSYGDVVIYWRLPRNDFMRRNV